MKPWRLLSVILILAAVSWFVSALALTGDMAKLAVVASGGPPADLHKLQYSPSYAPPSGGPLTPDHFVHPCGGMHPEPPILGLSPLALANVPTGGCTRAIGDPAVWQTAEHSYVVFSGYLSRLFHIWNVDDPYNPIVESTVPLPAGGAAATSIFDFKQGNNYYVSITMRGSGTGCGFFVYDVTNPANPQFVARKQGTDWCSPHEHFVSADAGGNADYAWVSMGNEGGSLYKVVVLDLSDLSNIQETGRYQRSDSTGSIYVHDVTVIGDRVFLSHWLGGLLIHDKQTLAHNIDPTPLNPIDSIRPTGFRVHHSWPTTDGNHVFVEDEFLNGSNQEKVKLYNISDINNPYYEMGLIGPDTAATSQAHNLKILNQGPGRDLLLIGWYKAGLRGFEVDTTGPSPVVTHTLTHQMLQVPGPDFGGAWGVDYLPCTINGQSRICLYTSHYVPSYGLGVDALGYDPSLDRYAPESQITDPTPDQVITTCAYTVQGDSHDYYTEVAGVEVSTDDGATWSPAGGLDNWTYGWTIPAGGTYLLKARARDQAGNVEAPSTAVTVTVASNCGVSTPTATVTVVPTLPAATVTATATACAMAFTDVLPSDYFYEAVRYLYCRDVISGYTDNTFRPYNNTTRGQLSKIVVLAEGFSINTTGGPHFTDVPVGSTFYDFVETAFNLELISGYGDGTFRPGNNVTRGQLCKIVVLAEDWTINTKGGPHFSDVPDTNTFYSFIETAYNRQIVSGYGCGPSCLEFRPGNNATRGQICKIVYSAISQPGE